ncbi:MAG: glucose 1-dehydrogenase [Solirubrobacteraceae bacterium]|nr:glucose 1-dehydrogenase [Solirubrobacteraceae bacterium]
MLNDKVCIITGGAGAIGRATAIEVARRGGRVMVADIADDAGEETVALVEQAGGEAAYQRCDLTDQAQVDALMDATVKRFGGIDVLHNNAGVHETDFSETPSLLELEREVWDKVVSINLTSIWATTRAAAPHLLRSERGPSIVNALSTGGLTAYPNGAAYCSTKGAVQQLTRVTAVELAPKVRCNCYAPAALDTPMLQKFVAAAEDPEGIVRSMAGTHLVPRLGTVEEVAKLVCFLASDDASFVNGATYNVDGGSLAWRGVRD